MDGNGGWWNPGSLQHIKTKGKAPSRGESSASEQEQRSRTSRATLRPSHGYDGSHTSRPDFSHLLRPESVYQVADAGERTSRRGGKFAQRTTFTSDVNQFDQYGRLPRQRSQDFDLNAPVEEVEPEEDQYGVMEEYPDSTHAPSQQPPSQYDSHSAYPVQFEHQNQLGGFHGFDAGMSHLLGNYTIPQHYGGHPHLQEAPNTDMHAAQMQAMQLSFPSHPNAVAIDHGAHNDEETKRRIRSFNAKMEAYNDKMHAKLVRILNIDKSAYDEKTGEFVRPEEYKLMVDPEIVWNPEDDDVTVYDALSPEQILLITENIRQIRPYSATAIQKQMKRVMKYATLKALLERDDQARIENVVQTVYPLESPKKNVTQQPWMIGLNNGQRRLVIERFAEATDQGPNEVRELFLARNVPLEVAQWILDAPPNMQMDFAVQNDLIVPVADRTLRWQKGISKIQRLAVMQRMLGVGISEGLVRDMLRRPYIPSGFGKGILRASQEAFEEVMAILRKKKG
ncbi:hypothetical protein CBS101457_000119 [Exobasidium rhododendri]|nr:hypothetical protein CBS101457_000119 [Exobasidium rhododendri]